MNGSPYRLGPAVTPKPLKYLIFFTAIISLLSALSNHLFPYFFGVTSPQELLHLSAGGIHQYYYWEFVSYLFVFPLVHGISFSLLISLAFNSYLLWVIGSSLIEKRGLAHFFILYFLSGIISGFAIFGIQNAMHSEISYAGNTTALYASLFAWLMLHPQAQLMLFLTIPIKAKWLILIIIGANFLIDISIGDWLSIVAYTSAILFSYLYCLLVWNIPSPFSRLNKMEHSILSLFYNKKSKRPIPSHLHRTKIYDFKTGEAILRDDEFMDAMLSKISQYGKESLTWKEKLRLKRISKRKAKAHTNRNK